MTGRKRYLGALQVMFAAAVLVVGAWGLPDDVRAEPLAPTAVAPMVGVVSDAAVEAIAPAGPSVFEVREASFGRVTVQVDPQSFALDTTAHVFGWNGNATDGLAAQSPDAGLTTRLESSPLPIPDGARHLQTLVTDRSLVTVMSDSTRDLDEVASFYTATFDSSFDVLRAPARNGATRLLVLTSGRIAGTVVLTTDAGTVTATITWNG